MRAEKLGPPVATSSALDRLESTWTEGNSIMGVEKLGPPVATSSALDRLESTCTGGTA
jgi:hypothetical protein